MTAEEGPWIKPHGSRSDGTTKRIAPKSTKSEGIRKDDIEVRSGNLIFSFGFPGSGKTTFQWFLINYLMNEGDFLTKIEVTETSHDNAWDGREIINEWKRLWIEGRLPAATPVEEGAIREVHCTVTPRSGQTKPLSFRFLEVSGELLRMALPQQGRRPDVAGTIKSYLNNKQMKFVLALMLHPDVEENDMLFPSFISYLEKEFPEALDRMSLAIIISKPQKSFERLCSFGSSDGRFNYDRFDEEAIEDYVNRFCGETYQIFNSWPNARKTMIAPLDIGDMELEEGELRLRQARYDHISNIFSWIYEQFNQVSLGRTFLQKIMDRLKFK